MGLLQREVAERLGVEECTYRYWELQGTVEPSVQHWPGIIGFLGYEPWEKPRSLGQELRAYRRRRGLLQKQLATDLGVDQTTLSDWELGRRRPSATVLALLKQRVSVDTDPLG